MDDNGRRYTTTDYILGQAVNVSCSERTDEAPNWTRVPDRMFPNITRASVQLSLVQIRGLRGTRKKGRKEKLSKEWKKERKYKGSKVSKE